MTHFLFSVHRRRFCPWSSVLGRSQRFFRIYQMEHSHIRGEREPVEKNFSIDAISGNQELNWDSTSMLFVRTGSQIPCSDRVPPNCLQYFQDVRGKFSSFNYYSIQSTLPRRGYMNNLDYTICIRHNAGYCNTVRCGYWLIANDNRFRKNQFDSFIMSHLISVFFRGRHETLCDWEHQRRRYSNHFRGRGWIGHPGMPSRSPAHRRRQVRFHSAEDGSSLSLEIHSWREIRWIHLKNCYSYGDSNGVCLTRDCIFAFRYCGTRLNPSSGLGKPRVNLPVIGEPLFIFSCWAIPYRNPPGFTPHAEHWFQTLPRDPFSFASLPMLASMRTVSSWTIDRLDVN